MANRLRHIALSVRDVAAAEKFFVDAFGMEKMGGSGRAVYVSDGTINIALLAVEGKPLGWEKDELFYGIDHFGVWVDDVAETGRTIEAAGGKHVMGNVCGDPTQFYEVKYRAPQGNLFDITAHGWVGAVKEVEPAGEAEIAPAPEMAD